MGMLSRIRSDILVKIIISIIIAIIVGIVPNYQRSIYKKLEPLTTEDVEKLTPQFAMGYLPADGSHNVSSVEEIKDSSYCTIKLKRSDLHPTGYYRILDEAQAGVQHSSGRRTPDQNNPIIMKKGLSIWMMNNMGPQYGQFYVAKLKSGEQVIVLLDHTLLPGGNKTIQLPIGRVEKTYPLNTFTKISQKFGLNETGKWYVDMAGDNFINSDKMDNLGYIRFGIAMITFILTYLLLSIFIYKRLTVS